MIELDGVQIMQWSDIEPTMRTETGYSRPRSDGLYMLVAYPGDEAWRDGYRIASYCRREHEPKPFLLCDGLGDDTLMFASWTAAITFLSTVKPQPGELLPQIMGLGDYWRHGDVPRRKVKYVCSRQAIDAIYSYGASASRVG